MQSSELSNSQPTHARVHAEVEFTLKLGLLTRVRRGESGLGGIGACALSGIVSASWNVSLASESSSESVTKVDSLGRKDGRTGALSFLGSISRGFSSEGTVLTFATFLDEPDADKSLALLAELLSPPVVVVVGLSSASQTRARRAPALRSLGYRRHGTLQRREFGCRR